MDPIGEYRAVISGGAVYDYRSRFLGMMHDGYIWDRDGRAVAFVMGARDGPALPGTGAIPRPPVAGPEPGGPSPPPVPERIPGYTMEWSDLSWDEFLSGRQKFIAYHS